MLVIFADFDGVLNRGSGLWKRTLVERFNRITNATGAVIVVHSSWRWGRTLAQIRNVLGNPAYCESTVVTGTVFDICPSAIHYKSRDGSFWISNGDFAAFRGGIETQDERAIAIQRWLNENPGKAERFIILDDSKNLGHFVGTPEFIQTNLIVGLTDEHVERAILHLKGVGW